MRPPEDPLSGPRSIFYLYRQRLPAAAPQALQILSTCHALAVAGAEVALVADLPLDQPVPGVEGLLETYGLEPHPRLHVRWIARRHPTLAGLQYRAELARWVRGVASSGRPAIAFSRRVDYAAQLLAWRRRLELPIAVVHEWHYVGSANALEAGRVVQSRRIARDEAAVLAGADGHVAVSNGLAAYLERNHPPAGPLVVIPNGGPPVVARSSAPAWLDQRLRVVYAGLFRRSRDFALLLEAAKALPPAVELVVIGGDESGQRLAEVQEMARAAGVMGRVRFTGPMRPIEVREALSTATVGVATFAESLNVDHFASPLKILEYQAAGVPLVATDFPTVRELVRHEETGLLVPPGDAGALVQAIRRVLEEPVLARHLSEQGQIEARERTWIRRGERLLAFLEARAGVGRRSSSSRP